MKACGLEVRMGVGVSLRIHGVDLIGRVARVRCIAYPATAIRL